MTISPGVAPNYFKVWGADLGVSQFTVAAKRRRSRCRGGYARVEHEAMARGLMVYPTGGNVDGVAGDNVLLAPPFIVDAPTVDAIVERLGDAVDAAVGAG